MFGREVVCIVVAAYIVDHYCFRGVIAVFHIAVVGYIVDHYFLMLDNMDHSSVKPQTVMVNNITSHNNMNHSSVKPQTVMVNNITGCLIEEWFILLWLLLLLTITV
jgi:hypothetical protein